jgi:hypothetical protein
MSINWFVWTPWDNGPFPVITAAGAAQPDRYVSSITYCIW